MRGAATTRWNRWWICHLGVLGVVVVGVGVGVGDGAGGCGRAVGSDADAGTGVITGEPQWAMLGATPQRNGRSRFVGPSQVTQSAVDLSDMAEGDRVSVLVSALGPSGSVYAITQDYNNPDPGALLALQPDGSVKWAAAVETRGGAALTSDGLLLFEGDDVVGSEPPGSSIQSLFGVRTDGSLLRIWHTPEQEDTVIYHRHTAPLVDSQGNVYVSMWTSTVAQLSSEGHHLCSFDATGAFRWCWDQVVGDPVSVAPAMDANDVLYVAVENKDSNIPFSDESADGVYALDRDGTERWHVLLPDTRLRTLALGDDGTLYYAGDGDHDYDGVYVGAVGVAGSPGWTVTFPPDYEFVTTSLAIAPSDGPGAEPTIYVGMRHALDGEGSEGALTALTRDGDARWTVETGGAPCGGLAVDATGAVYALIYASEDAGGGARILGLEPDGGPRLAADVADYLLQPLGCFPFLIIHYRNGPVLGDGGRIVFGSDDGKLHLLAP